MVVTEGAINNIMGGMENTAGVRLHSHRHKLKQRFDILKKLGQGTYGKVQLAVNKETGKEVAIKTIKKGKIETEQDLIRIRREIQIMSSVQHPQIIHIFEVFENRDKMVLVMEYAAGGELYDYLSERKILPEDEARRVFRQVSSAVYYCHKHKICHRDLKLENILLDVDGNAKIADFGLSNVFTEKHRLDTFCGSPLYASPEIVKGIPYVGPEVDCWSLGVLLYTLVYGAMPFDGSNFRRLVKQITQGDFFEPATPSNASELIRFMLMVKSSERATIEDICNHWWVNEGYKTDCLKDAEILANQTPVRLDLLLSLAPKQIDSEHMLIQPEEVVGGVTSKPGESLHPDTNLETDKISAVNADELATQRSHSAGNVPPTTSGSMEHLVKKKIKEKTPNDSEDPPVSKKKKKETTRRSLSKKDDGVEKKKSTAKVELNNAKITEEPKDPDLISKTDEVVKEKKKTKKRDSGEVKPEKKKVKKKEDKSSVKYRVSPAPDAATETSQPEEPMKVDSPEVVAASSPKVKVGYKKQATEEEKSDLSSKISEAVSPEEAKSPLCDNIDTDKILLETAAKIEAVEAALESERLAAAAKEIEVKPQSLIGSPISNKSSVHSSQVTSPTRSRTGSESSTDRTSSRRQSKIFSKAAMFDNLAAQNNSKSPPLEKPKRTTKPGSLNLTDLTKRFEEKSPAEKKTKIITPVKVSDAKRAFESKADRVQSQNSISRASSKSSDSQPNSPSSKLSPPESVSPKREIIQPKVDGKSVKTKTKDVQSKNIPTPKVPEVVSPKSKELSSQNESEPPKQTKGKENVQPSSQIKTKITPIKKTVPSSRLPGDSSTPEKLPGSKTKPSSSGAKIKPDNADPRVRQIEIKLESSDSSDSESEAERMLKTLTEKREKLEKAKAEKLKKVTETKDKEPVADITAIREEPRTPTTARHVVPNEDAMENDVKYSSLPRGFKTKEAESNIGRKSVPVSATSSHGDNSRKKAQLQINLSSSKPTIRIVNNDQPSRRDGAEFHSEVTHNLPEAGYTVVNDSSEREGLHLQRAHRERIIPIMLEDDADDSYQDTASRTSSISSVPMYSASSVVTPTPEPQISPREPIQKSRRERIIPIAVEGEGIITPTVNPAGSNFRRPMRHQMNQKFGRGSSTTIDRSDSFSSAGEDDDDDDGFQILTAESLFSTLLGRVRSLTRKMADDPRNLRRGPDSRLAGVGEPGTFWSSLYTGDYPARRLPDSLSREDVFGMWNRSLSREPSDADSVFSEPNSLPRGWRNRRSEVDGCRLINSGQTPKRVFYSRTLSRDFPKNLDCHSTRGRPLREMPSSPLSPNNMVSPLPKLSSSNIRRNAINYATLKYPAGMRRPHSIVDASDISGETHNWVNGHQRLPNSFPLVVPPPAGSRRKLPVEMDISQSNNLPPTALPAKYDKRESMPVTDNAKESHVLHTEPEQCITKREDLLINEKASNMITKEQKHVYQGSIRQTQREYTPLSMEESVRINTGQKIDPIKRQNTWSLDAKIINQEPLSRTTDTTSVQPSLARHQNETVNCDLQDFNGESIINNTKDSNKKVKTRNSIPVNQSINDKMNPLNSNVLRSVSPIEAYGKAISKDLAIPIQTVSRSDSSTNRFERSKSPYEKAKSSIENKLAKSTSFNNNLMTKTGNLDQGYDKAGVRSSSPETQPTLTLNISEIWGNTPLSPQKYKEVDRSKSMCKLFTAKINRSPSNLGDEQIKHNNDKIIKESKFNLIRPSRFLKGKTEKSSSRVSLADPDIHKREENVQGPEKKTSKRLSDALNRLLGRRTDDVSDQRRTNRSMKSTKVDDEDQSIENKHSIDDNNEELYSKRSSYILKENDNITNVKKVESPHDKIIINKNLQESELLTIVPTCNKSQLSVKENVDYVNEPAITDEKSNNCAAIINNEDESVMDRIKRKSYYSRFNEIKRKSKPSRIDSRESMDRQLAEAKARLLLDEVDCKSVTTEPTSPTYHISNTFSDPLLMCVGENKQNGVIKSSLSPERGLSYINIPSPIGSDSRSYDKPSYSENIANSLIPPEKLSFYREPRIGVNEKAYFRIAVRPPRPDVTKRISVANLSNVVLNGNDDRDLYKSSNSDNIKDDPTYFTGNSTYSTLPNRRKVSSAECIPFRNSSDIVKSLLSKESDNRLEMGKINPNEIHANSDMIDGRYINDCRGHTRNNSYTYKSVDQLKSKQNHLNELFSGKTPHIPTGSPTISAVKEDQYCRLNSLTSTYATEPRTREYRRTKTTPKLTDIKSVDTNTGKPIERLPYRRAARNAHLPIPPRAGDFRWLLSSSSNRTINRTKEAELNSEKIEKEVSEEEQPSLAT